MEIWKNEREIEIGIEYRETMRNRDLKRFKLRVIDEETE